MLLDVWRATSSVGSWEWALGASGGTSCEGDGGIWPELRYGKTKCKAGCSNERFACHCWMGGCWALRRQGVVNRRSVVGFGTMAVLVSGVVAVLVSGLMVAPPSG